ncbi:hypothetical protein CI109_104679 [Kwoniella shandongensis]|uniref:Uncharacterized protein n=1 Tax=Kwoniella shandongensis TaxID=1734106 RepID=A0A5M6BVG3_9TREE|nr:uncharacterized protein CI109_004844 [Kwoniella shandongensis]KAA5526844.1 hypothetical protein CI109_004844 [Kwoniella shandongensis]
MSNHQVAPAPGFSPEQGRYKGKSYDPNHVDPRSRKHQQPFPQQMDQGRVQQAPYGHDNAYGHKGVQRDQDYPRDQGYERDRRPSDSRSTYDGGYRLPSTAGSDYARRPPPLSPANQVQVARATPVAILPSGPSVAVSTPSLTSGSSVSTASTSIPVDFPRSSPSIIAHSQETSLDSLDKLRQFKAEVEATRQTKGVTELEPAKLAQMAESFIISQQLRQHMPVTGNDDNYVREQELKEKLRARQRSDESSFAVNKNDRQYDNQRSGSASTVAGVQNAPRLGETRRGPADNGGSQDVKSTTSDTPVYTNWDPRFQRREVKDPSTEAGHNDISVPGSGSTPSNFQPSEKNFVPARFLGKAGAPERSNNKPARGPSPPKRYQSPDNPYAASHASRRGSGPESQSGGQQLADRISGKTLPGRRPRSPSPARPARAAGYRPRSVSPHRPPTGPDYRAARPLSPPRGPSRDSYRRPPSPSHYPDPRTPSTPAFMHGQPDASYASSHPAHEPPTDPRNAVAAAYARRPLPPSFEPPPRDHERDRYPYNSRDDQYARSLPPPEYRRPIDDRYDRPPAPAPVATGLQGLDAKNVVETIEALKAQLTQLEKIATSAIAPPPPTAQRYASEAYPPSGPSHDRRYESRGPPPPHRSGPYDRPPSPSDRRPPPPHSPPGYGRGPARGSGRGGHEYDGHHHHHPHDRGHGHHEPGHGPGRKGSVGHDDHDRGRGRGRGGRGRGGERGHRGRGGVRGRSVDTR